MEIPSSHAGVVKELKVKVGDKVSEGSVILMLDAAEAAPPRRRPRQQRPHRRPRRRSGRARPPAPAQPRRGRQLHRRRPTSNATCWCSAPAPAAIPPPSARPTSA